VKTQFRFLLRILLIGAVACFLGAAAGLAQQNPKRLVLKDGTYQTVTKWEVQGKRVRYYSAERYMWEELPSDLVDWPATDKFNAERDQLRAEEVKEITKLREKELPEMPLVAPGLHLPDGGGVFVLDTYQDQPQLVELSQGSGEVNKQTGKNILRAAINPLAMSSKQTIELPGEHAQIQVHMPLPSVFVNVDAADATLQVLTEKAPDKTSDKPKGKQDPGKSPASAAKTSPDSPLDRYRIVRMAPKKGARVVGQLNVAVYGKVTQKQHWVKTDAIPQGAGWIKITPSEPLTPGEYAVVEVLNAAKNEINIYVWDFGVNFTAPANKNVWTARKPELGPDGKEKTPSLETRPK
jgi:hypothetical protein